MTTIRKFIEIDTILFLVVAASAGIFFAYHLHQTPFHLVTSLPSAQPTPLPTEPPLPTPVVTKQISPDGTKEVILNTQTQRDTTHVYTVSVANGDDTNQAVVYTASSSAEEHLALPFNAWSPDDTYFFLEDVQSHQTHALAFTASGKPLTSTQSYIDVTQQFIDREQNYTYTETTGWASATLLIINATGRNGNKQSFWFEVPSHALIPLATDF